MVPDGLALPIEHEVHSKVIMQDVLEKVPGEAPMMIWNDPVELKWSEEEREMLAEMGGYALSLVLSYLFFLVLFPFLSSKTSYHRKYTLTIRNRAVQRFPI